MFLFCLKLSGITDCCRRIISLNLWLILLFVSFPTPLPVFPSCCDPYSKFRLLFFNNNDVWLTLESDDYDSAAFLWKTISSNSLEVHVFKGQRVKNKTLGLFFDPLKFANILFCVWSFPIKRIIYFIHNQSVCHMHNQSWPNLEQMMKTVTTDTSRRTKTRTKIDGDKRTRRPSRSDGTPSRSDEKRKGLWPTAAASQDFFFPF